MATSYRLAGSVDFAAAANWSLGALASGQDLVIAEGADAFSLNMDQSSKDFTSVFFEQGYGSQNTKIGSGGSPLKLDTDLFKFGGKCAELNLNPGTVTSSIDELVWAPGNVEAKLLLGGTGAVGRMIVESGQVTINSGIDIGSGKLTIMGGTVFLESHASDVPDIVMSGGTLYLRRDWTSLKLNGKVLTKLELASGTGGSVELSGDATLVHVKGSFASLEAFGGRYDKSQLLLAASITGNADFYSGCTIITARDPRTDVTVVGTTSNRGRGPKYASA